MSHFFPLCIFPLRTWRPGGWYAFTPVEWEEIQQGKWGRRMFFFAWRVKRRAKDFHACGVAFYPQGRQDCRFIISYPGDISKPV